MLWGFMGPLFTGRWVTKTNTFCLSQCHISKSATLASSHLGEHEKVAMATATLLILRNSLPCAAYAWQLAAALMTWQVRHCGPPSMCRCLRSHLNLSLFVFWASSTVYRSGWQTRAPARRNGEHVNLASQV